MRISTATRQGAGAFLLPLVLPCLFLIGWEGAAQAMRSPVTLPTPGAVLRLLAAPLADLISMGTLLYNVAISLARVLAGFAAAVCLGVPLGVLMGYSPVADRLFVCLTALLRAIPPLAWIPLIMAWCGMLSLGGIFGVQVGPFYSFAHGLKISMLSIIFIGAFYPILTTVIHGVRHIPLTYIESAVVLGAGRRDIFMKILLPAALPTIVGGLRVGLGVAWTCLVAAEMMPGSPSGLGFLITQAYTVGRTDVVIAGMVCIGLTGAVLNRSCSLVETRCFSWKRAAR